MISLKRILVPTDFSVQSEKAVHYGTELATKFGAELHLLHAFEVTPITYGEGGAGLPQSVTEIEAAATKWLDEIKVSAGDVQVIRHVTEGRAFVEIVRYARKHTIDLVVIGTHGRGTIAHLLIGSVAENVVRQAPCPVLVVRDEEHDFVMP